MVLVSVSQDKVIIEFDSSTTELSREEAISLLNSLASSLGFRVYFLKPYVKYTIESANTLLVDIYEGRTAKSVKLHVDIVKAYIDVINANIDKEMKKREFVAEAIKIMQKSPQFKEDLAKFFRRGKFDWEKFYGDRSRYYLYYRAPVLLLEDLNKIVVAREKVKILKETNIKDVLAQQSDSFFNSEI